MASSLELGAEESIRCFFSPTAARRELWGIDLSPVQIRFAEETLRPYARRVRLLESPME